jgi:predicted metalloprotease with PDZ domain
MKKILFLLLLISVSIVSAQDKYEIFLDLNKVKKDRVKVSLKAPDIKNDVVEYVMPAVIPGSYSRKDYGRFIEKFKAYDKKGKSLKVEKDGNNIFKIYSSGSLDKIEYWVNDTWDAGNEMFIFQPGGTNIEAKKNFVINHQGFWGYFEGYKNLPYEINISKPASFYASTALKVNRDNPGGDILFAPDYVKLVDNPVMYCKPDTLSFLSGNTRVYISVYSQTESVKSSQIKSTIEPLATSLTSFFGQMPVNHYHFIFYFPEMRKQEINRYGGYGALEHSYSSFYFLPEMSDGERLKSMVQSVAAHEFLHILTPLNIHSKEIGNFDFRNPKMSRHLWMYEGVTEYFADLVQVRNRLTSYDDFKEEIRSKITAAEKYPNISFTEMSQNILNDEYKDMFSNVYQKGALLAFLLDIRLHELSKGRLSLKDVMMLLSEKYGPDKPFKDEELFNDFVSFSYPEIKNYFDDYVIGNKALPFEEYFYKIGWKYQEFREDSMKTFGRISFTFDSKKKRFITMKTGNNVFGLEDGDAILAVNNIDITIENYAELLTPIIEAKDTQEIIIKFIRNEKNMTAKARPVSAPVKVKNVLDSMPTPDESQRNLKKQLLNLY